MTKTRSRVHIDQYLFLAKQNNVAQFRDKSFVIAVSDPNVLRTAFGCQVHENSDFAMDESVIVTRRDGHEEVWTNPHIQNYRESHFAFFDDIGIYLPSGYGRAFDSDHAYPASAAKADSQVALVKMNFIHRSGNRNYGAGLERRRTHTRRNRSPSPCQVSSIGAGGIEVWTPLRAVATASVMSAHGSSFRRRHVSTTLRMAA